jgi:hypothetical protein
MLGGMYGGHVYGVNADRVRRIEAVVRVNVSGGEVATLFSRSIERSGGYQGAPFYFQDLAVGPPGVFLADQGLGSLIKLSHEGGTPITLLQRKFLIGNLFLLKGRIFYDQGVFFANCGLVGSIDTSGGNPVAAGSGQCWALASDGDRLFEVGRDEAIGWGIPRISALDEAGKRTYGERLRQINMTNLAVDDQCVYYTRVDPASVTWYSAIPKPKL